MVYGWNDRLIVGRGGFEYLGIRSSFLHWGSALKVKCGEQAASLLAESLDITLECLYF